MITELITNDGKPDTVFLHPKKWNVIARSMQEQRIYSKAMAEGVNFPSIKFMSSAGDVDVIASPCCPETRAYVLQKDTWKLLSNKPVPHFIEDMRGSMIWSSNKDAVELRVGSYCNLIRRRKENE